MKLDVRCMLNSNAGMKQISFIGFLCVSAIILTTIQDLLHSYFNNYSFYLSESLLYKSFWVLFFPVSILQIFIINHFKQTIFKTADLYNIILITLLSSVIHLISFSLFIFAGSSIFFSHTYQFFRTLTYSLSEDFFKYMLIYGVLAFTSIKNASINSTERKAGVGDKNHFPVMLSVGTGKKYNAINADDILFISAATPYIYFHTIKGKFLYAETLKSILEKLDRTQFIRIHKSAIVNMKQVSSYTSRLNGDYDIVLKNGELIRMSRNYTSLFKQYFL